MSLASAKVFGTTELVELILLQDLSAAEVTRARRINSFFRAVVDNSKPLRRVIFLEPVERKIYKGGAAMRKRQDEIPAGVCQLYEGWGQCSFTTLHPAIDVPVSGLLWPFKGYGVPPAHWTSGQWQSMLISQPPAAGYYLLCKEHGDGERIEGQTLGAIRETSEKLKAQRGNCRFSDLTCAGTGEIGYLFDR